MAPGRHTCGTRRLLGAAVFSALVVAAGAQEQRQPGTLLLNMLIKNEAEHLSRSLPKWAPLIDYRAGTGSLDPNLVASASEICLPSCAKVCSGINSFATPSARSFAQQGPPARLSPEGLAADRS
jgi:hypothetical protein